MAGRREGGGEGAASGLEVFVDLMSQPSRAVVIFCRCNNIPHDVKLIKLMAGEQRTKDYKSINPLGKVPAINDRGYKLAESHAILRYLVATRTCEDHWYPNDAASRARIDMVLDWHLNNLRKGSAGLLMQAVMAPILGKPYNAVLADDSRAVLRASLHTIDRVWLKHLTPTAGGNSSSSSSRRGNNSPSPFLLGALRPTLADLSLACEALQLQRLGPNQFNLLLDPVPNVRAWLAAVREALNPHFDDVHRILYAAVAQNFPTVSAASAASQHPPLQQQAGTAGAPASGGNGETAAFVEGREMGQLYTPSSATIRLSQEDVNVRERQFTASPGEGFPEGKEMGGLYSPQAAVSLTTPDSSQGGDEGAGGGRPGDKSNGVGEAQSARSRL